MTRLYQLVCRAHGEYDPVKAAELEVEWWREHREHQRSGVHAEDASGQIDPPSPRQEPWKRHQVSSELLASAEAPVAPAILAGAVACNDPGVPSRPNVFAETFSIERGDVRADPLASQAGAEQLGGTLYELLPGSDGMPLHVHHGIEELAVVIAGAPTLRTLEGEFELAAGDVVAFPRGRRGAHTLVNRSDAPARYLMLSTKVMPEIVEYPEQGTIRVLTRPPFAPVDPEEDPGDRLMLLFDRSAAKQDRPPS